jgi:hypothetical protein
MPQVIFEPTIPVFERAKTVHALDREDTLIGKGSAKCNVYKEKNSVQIYFDHTSCYFACIVDSAGYHTDAK